MADERDDTARTPGIEIAANIAIIGEDAETQSVSLRTLQAVYNELTGKTEELSRHYDKPFQVTFADLEQLNIKYTQVCEQYHIESSTTAVSVFHLDDTKEVFSSFERFRIYNTSATSPVEQVVLKYSFLIVLPKTRKPQTYTVEIRVVSRIAALRKLRRDAPPFVRVLGGQTAFVRVEYVDYMVARSLLAVTEGWFAGVPVAQGSAWFKSVRRHSEWFNQIGEYSMAGVTLFSVFRVLPSLVPATADPTALTRFLVGAVAMLFLAYRIGHLIGSKVEDALDSWEELAYLKLNRGDEVELASATRDNNRAIVKVVLGGIVTFLLGVIASLVANAISKQ